MQNLPFYVYLVFGITVLITVGLLFKASHWSRFFLLFLVSWISLQSVLALVGFYTDPQTMTKRFPLLFLPALFFLGFRFATKKGRAMMGGLDLGTLTLINTVRLPVEFVLYWLMLHQTIPEAMTFHGRNFDVFSGITALPVYYFGFVKKNLGRRAILIWNLVCLLLLVNVVSNALLSLPGRFQQFGFERPNTALGFFPFILLPAFLVPAVLFSMLASIWQLTRKPGLAATDEK